ncbi:MAG: DUF998 domain-containing protein [Candidatus Bathyarchaeota archaeon]|nr:DUF998 domain-containing protein [Candidatus Bathyarchaeota archaeon]
MDRGLKTSGIIGFAAPIFTFTCILAAIASWPQFSWTNNALSDLGVQSGFTAILFNSGLVIGGILFAVFATGLYSFAGKRFIGKVGAACFFLAWIALIAIGIFNENFRPTHYIVSVMLFVFLPISLLIFVATFWIESKRRLSGLTLALALVAAAVWVLQLTVEYVPNVAIPEFISGLAGAAWVWVLSYLMLKKASQTPNT